MKSENWIEEKLAALRDNHQFRSLRSLPAPGGHITLNGRKCVNFSSNDYLDFLNREEIRSSASEAVLTRGSGSGSSRLVTGNLEMHEKLEAELAGHKGYPSALLFGSGFLTNLGVVTSLVGRGDTVIADKLVHASLIDAVRLSGAQLIRFNHNDTEHAEGCFRKANKNGRILVMTESVFSMDGDLAPLEEIASMAASHGAMLMVDEAHSSGVFGPQGRGLIAAHHLQDRVNLSMCTFSKALGSYGGIVACSNQMRDWLINTARPFIYTTALPPGVCAASRKALEILDREPDLGSTLLTRAASFRTGLNDLGFNTGNSESQIIPVIVGENSEALNLASAMRDSGIMVSAIRPPTVPRGTARLRFSVTLAHSREELEHTAKQLLVCVKKLKLEHILQGG